jgi:PIN domain nuclease of toxin-antitoxin system
VILLDTHIWVWWVHGDTHLSKGHIDHLKRHEEKGLGISVMTCREVAKLFEYNRLSLPCPIADWFEMALNYPGITLLELTPRIAIESTQLPGSFHRDPVDQIIVATARVNNLPILTADTRILKYSHVQNKLNSLNAFRAI